MSERSEAMEEAAIVRSIRPQVVGRGIPPFLYGVLALLGGLGRGDVAAGGGGRRLASLGGYGRPGARRRQRPGDPAMLAVEGGLGVASMLAYALLAWLWRPVSAAALRPVAA